METQAVRLFVERPQRPRVETPGIQAERRDLSIAVGNAVGEHARLAREALLTRLHEQRHGFLDLREKRTLTLDEEQEFSDLRREIDRWELIGENERRSHMVRDLSDLADRILGDRSR